MLKLLYINVRVEIKLLLYTVTIKDLKFVKTPKNVE